MNEQSEVYVTHYFNDLPPKSGLLDLSFLTATKESLNENRYFMGYEKVGSLSEMAFKHQVHEGSIVKLPNPLPVNSRKTLWMDSAGIVYVADSEEPYSDLEKKAVYDSKAKKSLI